MARHLYEVRAKTQVALDRAQKQSRPTVLEIDTYRYYGHSVADAKHKVYRTEEEIERYKKEHDPIGQWRAQLVKEGLITDEAYTAMDKDVRKEDGRVGSVRRRKPVADGGLDHRRCLFRGRSADPGRTHRAAFLQF